MAICECKIICRHNFFFFWVANVIFIIDIIDLLTTTDIFFAYHLLSINIESIEWLEGFKNVYLWMFDEVSLEMNGETEKWGDWSCKTAWMGKYEGHLTLVCVVRWCHLWISGKLSWWQFRLNLRIENYNTVLNLNYCIFLET